MVLFLGSTRYNSTADPTPIANPNRISLISFDVMDSLLLVFVPKDSLPTPRTAQAGEYPPKRNTLLLISLEAGKVSCPGYTENIRLTSATTCLARSMK
ncbi:hypothetical protein FJY90_02370 [Candidatus Gottesmanbacteria bacterium]|nr:hypothetical protein [Candidatus Gottesmanbacteria bacterium]